MHVLAVSAITDGPGFDQALKSAYATGGAGWVLSVMSADGTRAVNVVVHDSVDAVRDLLEARAAPFATTEYLEADAGNAFGLADG